MTAATNPLSYNGYIQNMGILAVYTTADNAGVTEFIDAPPQLSVPQMLNYAELRIQRDLDMLPTQSSNTYPLTPGQGVFPLPVDDFFTVQTLEIIDPVSAPVVDSSPMVGSSKDFIQNVYSAAALPGRPKFFAMYGDTFGGLGDTNTNILFGPAPDQPYTLRVTGTQRMPSLNKSAVAGIADTQYTYISAYYPDMLTMASMIYITMLQRNFGPAGDTPEMGMTYEKQYQILRVGAVAEENRRKQMGSAWSSYSTPVSATATR